MAIQIDEKLLSPEAKQALENAKSKSKFVRDAIEAYVNSKFYLSEFTKEIKDLLSDITSNDKNSNVQPDKSLDQNTNSEDIKKPGYGLSEEEKLKREKLLDSSLDLF